MSNSIDERIVRLGFDNAKFEAGVSKSMSTLDKLKEKLQFKGAEQGVTSLQKSINGVDFSSMTRGIESLEKRFSTMGIVGMNIIGKITDSVIGAAKKLESATIGQIESGGWSRAMNLANAQFQIEGLGEDWAEMQKAISYGVKDTAYGLDAAATAASSLVASGVAYKESIDGANDSLMHKSLRAISGVAAMTNSSYEDISRIFTTIAGNGRLMGDQLLQLSSRGLNVAASLAKVMNTTEAEVRDMVSAGKISFETFAEAMDDAFGAHAKEANKTFTGALSNMKAALSRFGAVFATPIIENTNTLFISLTSRIDELKGKLGDTTDAAGKTVSGLGTHFTEMWKSGIAAFSALVEAVDLSWFDKVVDKVDGVTVKITRFFDTLKEYLGASSEDAANGINDATKTLRISAEEAQAARDIIEKGMYGSGAARQNALTELFGGGEAGAQSAKNVQAYVDAVVKAGWNYEKSAIQVAAATSAIGASSETVAEIVQKSKITHVLNAVRTVLGDLWRTLKNIGKNIGTIAKSIAKAFTSVFKIDLMSVADGATGLSGAIADLSEKMLIGDETADKITKVFTFFFKAINKGISVIKNAAINAKEFFVAFKETDLFRDLKSGFERFVDTITSSSVFAWLKEKIEGLFDTSGDYDFFGRIKDFFLNMADVISSNTFFSDVGEKISGLVSGLSGIKLPDSVSGSSFVTAITNFADSVSTILSGDSDIPDKIAGFFRKVVEAITNIDWARVASTAKIALGIYILWQVNNLIKTIDAIGKTINTVLSVPSKIAGLLGSISTAIKEAVSPALKKSANALLLTTIGNTLLKIAAIVVVMASMPEQDMYRGLSVVITAAGIILLLAKMTGNMAKSGKDIAVGFTAVKKLTIKLGGLSLLIMGLAGVIAGVVWAFNTVSKIENFDAVWNNTLKIIGVVSAIVAAIIVIVGLFLAVDKAITAASTKILPIAASIAIVVGSFSTALVVVASALLLLSKIPVDQLETYVDQLERIIMWLAGGISIMFAVLAVANAVGGHIDVGQLLGLSVVLLAFTAAVVVLLGAVATAAVAMKLGGMTGLDLAGAMVAVATMVAVVAGAMFLIGRALSKGGSFKGLATSLLAMVVVIAALGIVAAKLATIEGSISIIVAVGAVMTVMLLSFVAIIGVLGLLVKEMGADADPSGVLLSLGAAFVMIAASMLILAAAIKIVASLDSGLMQAAIAFGVFVGVVVILAAVAAGFQSFRESLTAVGQAFLYAGVGALLVGAGVFLVAEAFKVVANAIAILTPNLEAFFTTLEAHKLTAILVGAAAVAVIFLLVKGIVELSSVLKPIVELFVTAVEAILLALENFFGRAKDSEKKNGKELSAKTKATIVNIILGMCAAIIAMTPEMLNTLAQLIIKILSWLGSIAGSVAEGLVNFLVNVINGVSDAIMQNSGRIVDALRSVLYAIADLVLNIVGELIAGVVGAVSKKGAEKVRSAVSGISDELMARNIELRAAAEESADTKKALYNSLIGAESSISEFGNTGQKSMGDTVKSFLGLGSAAESSADSVSDATDSLGGSMRNMAASSKWSMSQFVSSVKSGSDDASLAFDDFEISDHLDDEYTESLDATGGFAGNLTDLMGGAGEDSIASFITNFGNNSDLLNFEMDENLSGITDATEDYAPAARKEGSDLAGDIANGVGSENSRGKMQLSTAYMLGGITKEINDFCGDPLRAPLLMRKLATTLHDKFDEYNKIESPSKLYAESAGYIVLGISEGIQNKTAEVAGSMHDLSDLMIISFGSPLETIAAMIRGDIPVDTSIRPVVDMTSVNSGMASFRSAFDGGEMSVSGQLAADISGMDRSIVAELQSMRADMNAMTKAIDELGRPNQTFENQFDIKSDNPRAVADEVSRILQRQVERREASWA